MSKNLKKNNKFRQDISELKLRVLIASGKHSKNSKQESQEEIRRSFRKEFRTFHKGVLRPSRNSSKNLRKYSENYRELFWEFQVRVPRTAEKSSKNASEHFRELQGAPIISGQSYKHFMEESKRKFGENSENFVKLRIKCQERQGRLPAKFQGFQKYIRKLFLMWSEVQWASGWLIKIWIELIF